MKLTAHHGHDRLSAWPADLDLFKHTSLLCGMQRGFANKGKQKQEAEERRKLALLQFQDDRDRRRLLDEQHQASLAQETASPRSPRSATNLHGQEPPLSPQTKKDQ